MTIGGRGKKMVRAIEVKARDGYRIWLRYSDGVSGEIDLSDLVGQGVFRAWNERAFFDRVYVTPHGSIAWSPDIEICPDALYIDLTGNTIEGSEMLVGPVAADA